MTQRVAVIGAGYWGPNLARNFRSSDQWELAAVCDTDEARARKVAAGADIETSVERLLLRDDVDAVAIATPARTHRAIAMAALEAGKHVLVEKPLASSRVEALDIVRLAAERGLTVMCDHTFCYTPVVERIAEMVGSGELGEVLFIDSVRINLGLVQPDVDVIWDLAPHDLSIMDFVLPGGLAPQGVSAHGADPIGAGRACVGYLTMPLAHGAMAHVHVNWLSPTKIRQLVIGGSRRTLVWDDMNPQQRLSVYDRGIDLQLDAASAGLTARTTASVSYRVGDMYAPALPEREALGAMVDEFAAAILGRRPARTDGASGLRVLSVLEAVRSSLADSGALVPVDLSADLPVTQGASA